MKLSRKNSNVHKVFSKLESKVFNMASAVSGHNWRWDHMSRVLDGLKKMNKTELDSLVFMLDECKDDSKTEGYEKGKETWKEGE